MIRHDSPASVREILISEIIEEFDSLDALDLDAFLRELGEDPEALLEAGRSIRRDAIQDIKIAPLRAAQERLKAKKSVAGTRLIDLGSERKREIFEKIKRHSEASGAMTLAARNREIESEQDLDTFLEACFRLGLIDEAGGLLDE